MKRLLLLVALAVVGVIAMAKPVAERPRFAPVTAATNPVGQPVIDEVEP